MLKINRPKASNKFLFIALLCLLVWLPWPLGGNRDWAWPIMSCASSVILVSWLFANTLKGRGFPKQVYAAKIPLLFMIAYLIYIAMQIAPIPYSILATINHTSAEAYINSQSHYFSISVDRAETLTHLLKSFTYVALFFLVLVLADSKKRLKQIIWVIVITAVLQTIYGALSIGEVEAFVKAKHNTLQGSFPNRNHYAGFMEIGAGLGIGLCMTYFFSRNHRHNALSKIAVVLRSITGELFLMFAALTVILAGLLLSESRGGFLAFFSSFILVFSIGLIIKRSNVKGGSVLLIASLLLIVISTTIINSNEVLSRLLTEGVSGRDFVWLPAKEMFKDYFLFGSGMGTFQVAFTAYYPSYSQTWWHAHMNYLQLLIELGIVGFVIFAGGTISALIIILKAFVVRRDPFALGAMFGVLVATISILIHELVDYQFYIPSNAAYFYLSLGIGIVATTINTENIKRKMKKIKG